MWTVDLDNMVCTLVDHFLNRRAETEFVKNPETHHTEFIKEGIIIPIEMHSCWYGEDGDGKSFYYSIYMMFCGNTSVFIAPATDENHTILYTEIDPSLWINTSNHDSCWRSDGFREVTDLYFKMCEKTNPDVAPKDISTSASIGKFMSLGIEKVKIHMKNKDNNRYGYDIISVTPLKKEELA